MNLLYLEKQLTKEDIERYLKRISILIRKEEVKRTRRKTMSEYGKLNDNNFSETI